MNSSVLQIATVLGPAVGGILYLAGPAVAYGTVLVLAAAAASLMVQVRGQSAVPRTREPASWHTLLSGLQFVRSRPIVLGAISLDLFAVLFGGATALLPMYASDILHIGPSGLGLLRTAPGVGAALCGLVLAVSPITRHVGAWMFGGVAVFGVATIVFGLSDSFVLSLVALTILGAADMVSVYVRHLLVQLETPDFIRGRVSAVSAVFIGASNELGDFESGVTARWWGAMRAVVIGGLATLAVTGLWTRLFPMLWRMQEFPQKKNE
jgi:MFS family permease